MPQRPLHRAREDLAPHWLIRSVRGLSRPGQAQQRHPWARLQGDPPRRRSLRCVPRPSPGPGYAPHRAHRRWHPRASRGPLPRCRCPVVPRPRDHRHPSPAPPVRQWPRGHSIPGSDRGAAPPGPHRRAPRPRPPHSVRWPPLDCPARPLRATHRCHRAGCPRPRHRSRAGRRCGHWALHRAMHRAVHRERHQAGPRSRRCRPQCRRSCRQGSARCRRRRPSPRPR
jgi:hypothetical protein